MSIHPLVQYGEQGADNTLFEIWNKILFCKFSQNEEHKRVLINTNNLNLVEFSRMKPENKFWSGQIMHGTKGKHGIINGGELLGFNYMGKMLMMTRDLM